MHNEDLIHIGGYDFIKSEALVDAYAEFQERLRKQLADEVNIPGDLLGITGKLATSMAVNRMLFGTPLSPDRFRRAFVGHRREDAVGVSMSAEVVDLPHWKGVKASTVIFDEGAFIKGVDWAAGPDRTVIMTGRQLGKSELQRQLMEQLTERVVTVPRKDLMDLKMKIERAHTLGLNGQPYVKGN